ncbi:plasmid mobilization relaxosome protein MobC, partial [Dysosmobacter welbionis]
PSPRRDGGFFSNPCNESPASRTYLTERREMPLANMEEIYQAHARTVYKFLLSQCHDADLAEELTQETFYQAVRSIDRFNGSCKVSVWLCQIAKHLWYQHLRKRKPEEP